MCEMHKALSKSVCVCVCLNVAHDVKRSELSLESGILKQPVNDFLCLGCCFYLTCVKGG